MSTVGSWIVVFIASSIAQSLSAPACANRSNDTYVVKFPTFNTETFIDGSLHEWTLSKGIFSNDSGSLDKLFGNVAHAVGIAAGLVGAHDIADVARLPLAPAFDNILDDLVLPKIVDDTVRHGENNVVFFNDNLVHDCDLVGCVGTVCAQLPRTVEPVPLLGRLEYDVLISRSDDENLRIT